jgi:uncharacterized protein
MLRRLLLVVGTLMLWVSASSAQTPSPDAMAAARSLVVTMKQADQYRALLPEILLTLKPQLTQDRPEIERDYEAMTPVIVDAFAPYVQQMVDQLATVYANSFSVDELKQIEAFYKQPVGQKLLAKDAALEQAATQIGEDGSRKAAEDLRSRLTQALRQKGHKL